MAQLARSMLVVSISQELLFPLYIFNFSDSVFYLLYVLIARKQAEEHLEGIV